MHLWHHREVEQPDPAAGPRRERCVTLSEPEITEATSSDVPVVRRSRWRLVSLAELLAVLVPTLMGAFLVVLHVHAFTSISVFDEFPHFAYAYDVAHGRLPVRGDAISQGALAELACRSWQSGWVPPCTDPAADPATVPHALDVTYYPEAGQTYTTDHPPLYYAITGIGGRLVAAVTGLSQFVAMRLMGIFWIALGNVFLWLTMRRLRVPPAAMFAALMLLMSIPATIYTASTINPDAASVPVAALMGWAIIRWWQGALAPGWLALVGAAVVGTKITNGVVIFSGLVLLALLGYAGYRSGRARIVRDWLVASLSLGLGGAVVLVGWTFRYHHTDKGYSLADIAVGVPTLPSRKVGAFDPRWLVNPDLTMVASSDRNPGTLPHQFQHVPLMTALSSVIAIVILVAVVAVLRQPYAVPRMQLAVASLAAPILGSAVWALYNYDVLHSFVPPGVRYFYSVLALQVVVVGLALRARWATLSVAAVGIVTWLAYVRMLRSG
jgi:hypothetical protein